MIRDNNKIYGEVNDPNTVLSQGILPNNELIVGDGNKSIKTFSPGGNNIIYLKNGVVSSFPLNMSNKMLGTDESGNLTLLDYNEGYTKIDLFGSDNAISNVQSSNIDVSISNIVNSNGYSSFKISNSNTTGTGNITIQLTNPIDLSEKDTIAFIWSSILGNLSIFSKISLANDTNEEVLVDLSNAQTLILSNQICNINPGIYDKIKIETDKSILSFDTINDIMTVMGIILY